ncbi:RNA polymerase sigma factor [Amycolatopsis nigrescens]|uniref:RNA polymerase sigma factor n=1 Tax=Amycolatopsis nigrescens TaxID=381445 RepID=UPI00035D5707|nr:sigma-70 family RNA polymerase sigma factor [Amycolatopsis nigrescens]
MQAMTKDHEPGEPASGADRPDLGGADPAPVFSHLFDTHAPPLHRYLARRVGSETANDLLSETFLVALRRRDSYKPEAGTVRGWLYGIATNLVRHHTRTELRALKATARMAAEHPATAGPETRVAERVDAQTMAAQLAGALTGLSTEDRDTLLLSAWGGLEPTEVAEALGIPAGTVRSRLHRIRKSLRVGAPNVTKEEPVEVADHE